MHVKYLFAIIFYSTLLLFFSCKPEPQRFDVLRKLDLKEKIVYPSGGYHVSQIDIVNGYAVQDSFKQNFVGKFNWFEYKDQNPNIIRNINTSTCVVASTLQLLIFGAKYIEPNFLFSKQLTNKLDDKKIAILFAEISQMAYKIYKGIYTNGIGMAEMNTMVNGNAGNFKGILTDWTNDHANQKLNSPFSYHVFTDKTLIPAFIINSLDSGIVVSMGIHKKGTYDPYDAETLNHTYFINKDSNIGHQITIVNYAYFNDRLIVVYEDSMAQKQKRCAYLDDLLLSSQNMYLGAPIPFLRMKTR